MNLILLIALIGLFILIAYLLSRKVVTPSPEPLPSPQPSPSPPPIHFTTLDEIVSGKFPSATDKRGTNGVQVTVVNLTVQYTHDESDGDVHVAVKDPTGQGMICEIIPTLPLPKPANGGIITITGIPYADHVHENESWHYLTAWQLHPILKIEVQ